MKRLMTALAVMALAAGATGCASKKFVNNRVDEVNSKVTNLSKTMEETQERVRKNEQKITEVDQKADVVGQRADAAGKSASEARSVAVAATAKAEAVEAASRKLVYEVVLSDDEARFKSGKALLSDEAKVEIDELVNQIQAQTAPVYIEIEGHTDAQGSEDYNHKLGLDRAEAVKSYLYQEHNIPLHKMNVISYGESKPLAPNNTRDGRMQNRRVVIKVLT